jgi:hypothetical protein
MVRWTIIQREAFLPGSHPLEQRVGDVRELPLELAKRLQRGGFQFLLGPGKPNDRLRE